MREGELSVNQIQRTCWRAGKDTNRQFFFGQLVQQNLTKAKNTSPKIIVSIC